MARISINIAVFLILLNASSGFIMASGIAGDWGVQPSIGGDNAVENVEEKTSELNPRAGGETLLGLYSAVTRTFKSLVGIVFAGPMMFNNLGVPEFITTFVFAPMYLIVGADTIYVLSGRLLS